MKVQKNVRIAINGFGRIGRLLFRQLFGMKGFEIVAINDLGDIENLAYLLKYDSVYRTYDKSVEVYRAPGGVGGRFVVGGQSITIVREKDPTKLPWGDLRVDIVIESTGVFESFAASRAHLTSGAARVVITAPAKDEETTDAKTLLVGLADKQFGRCVITSNGSCTTNAAHPVMAVLDESIGIAKAVLATVHGYTATQNLVDSPTKGKDFRRGRAAAQNIALSFTGAALSVARALPQFVGKFDGLAYRVPIITGSLADITLVTKKKTTVEEVNDALTRAAMDARWSGILKVTDEQIVSSDVIGEPYGAIVDLAMTKVIDGDLVKVLSWYDNEWGYVATLVQHVMKVAAYL